jgi:hypothetical protein
VNGRLVTVPAWLVCQGDVGPTGLTVAAVYRDVVRGRARIVWSNGGVQDAAAESSVTLTARPTMPGACPGPRPGVVEAALLWLRRAHRP